MNANQIICVKYNWYYWILYLFIMPMAGMMGTAIIYGILKDLLAIDNPKQYIIPIWIFTIAIAFTVSFLPRQLNPIISAILSIIPSLLGTFIVTKHTLTIKEITNSRELTEEVKRNEQETFTKHLSWSIIAEQISNIRK